MKVINYLEWDENRQNKVYGHTLSLSTGIRVTDGNKGKSLFIPFSFFAEESITDTTLKGGKIVDVKVTETSEVDKTLLLKALRNKTLTSAKYNKVLKAAIDNLYVEIQFDNLKINGAKLDIKGLTKNIHMDWREGESDYESNAAAEATMLRNVLLIYLGKDVVTRGKVTLFPSNTK